MDERLPLRIIAATRNPAKLREFQRVVGDLAIIEPIPQDISLSASEEQRVEEASDSATIAEQKALAWSRAIRDNRIVMASDGGLTIPALGSAWNPARTRRFAGSESTDLERARRLLKVAALLEDEQRVIGWKESLCIARNGEPVFDAGAEGTYGYLATDVTPDLIDEAGGFWVSALWICPEYGGQRLVELTPEERERRADHWYWLSKVVQRRLAEYMSEQDDLRIGTPGSMS
jgi:inosine/xanthosine triphosphate pyrophosphatase family protein